MLFIHQIDQWIEQEPTAKKVPTMRMNLKFEKPDGSKITSRIFDVQSSTIVARKTDTYRYIVQLHPNSMWLFNSMIVDHSGFLRMSKIYLVDPVKLLQNGLAPKDRSTFRRAKIIDMRPDGFLNLEFYSPFSLNI